MSFVAAALERLEDRPERVALAQGEGRTRRELTARALAGAIARARRALRAAGIGPGDRLALVAGNSPEWLALDLAVLAEGAALVPLDPRAGEGGTAGLSALVEDADPRLLVVDQGAAALQVPGVPRRRLEDLFAGTTPPGSDPLDIPGDALASLIYTSGSSGRPKGAMLTRSNLGFMLARTEARLAELTGLGFGAERALHYLPLCYAGSHVLALSCLLRGARLELVADPRRLGEALAVARPDYFLNVPLVLERFERAAVSAIEARGPALARLLREARAAGARRAAGQAGLRDRALLAAAEALLFKRVRARFGPRLRGLICGSAPLSPATQGFFELVGVPVYQGYGLTETTALCTLDLEGKVLAGRVGPALPGVALRRSPEGEVETRGPHVFAGYWGRPDATLAAFTRDGWLRTGDLGDVDAEGRWRIVGRKSAMLVLASGHNLAPEPLEEELRAALVSTLGPAWADLGVVVVGHGRPHAAALIAPPPDSPSLDPARLDAALAAFNQGVEPKRRVFRCAVLPEPLSAEGGLLTANLKPRRAEIAARYAELIEGLYARGGAAPMAAVEG
ncbi:MAG: AMP-binding protein [Planctomycetota bacterium]